MSRRVAPIAQIVSVLSDGGRNRQKHRLYHWFFCRISSFLKPLYMREAAVPGLPVTPSTYPGSISLFTLVELPEGEQPDTISREDLAMLLMKRIGAT